MQMGLAYDMQHAVKLQTLVEKPRVQSVTETRRQRGGGGSAHKEQLASPQAPGHEQLVT